MYFNKIQIVRPIGSGSFGEVYLVITPSKQLLAMKVERKDINNQDKLTSYLTREYQFLQALNQQSN